MPAPTVPFQAVCIDGLHWRPLRVDVLKAKRRRVETLAPGFRRLGVSLPPIVGLRPKAVPTERPRPIVTGDRPRSPARWVKGVQWVEGPLRFVLTPCENVRAVLDRADQGR